MSNKNFKMPKEFVKRVKDTIKDKQSLEGEIKQISYDGQELWFQNSIMPILNDNGEQIGEVIVRYDITDKKVYEKLSITDSLTGLYNRRYFNEILTREVSRATREKTYLSFLILDIDFFKKYNDTYGHDAGDKALISVAHAINKSLKRGSDYVFRLGGEEFGILFSQNNEIESLELANKIRKNIEKLNILHSNSKVANHITASIGLLCVNFIDEIVGEHGFYTMADDALYQAKRDNRNKVVSYKNDNLEFF